MKKYEISIIALSFVLLTLLNSCNESDSTYSHLLPEFWDNLTESDWKRDSTSTVNNLLGTWKLTHRYCCPESTTGGRLVNVESEAYQLAITSEKISVFINGELTQESRWSLITHNAPAFQIHADPYITNTFGQIVLSQNSMLLFYGSPSDGPDNYFEKIIEGE